MRAAHYTYGVQGRIVYTVCSTHRVINPNVKASRRVATQIGRWSPTLIFRKRESLYSNRNRHSLVGYFINLLPLCRSDAFDEFSPFHQFPSFHFLGMCSSVEIDMPICLSLYIFRLTFSIVFFRLVLTKCSRTESRSPSHSNFETFLMPFNSDCNRQEIYWAQDILNRVLN